MVPPWTPSLHPFALSGTSWAPGGQRPASPSGADSLPYFFDLERLPLLFDLDLAFDFGRGLAAAAREAPLGSSPGSDGSFPLPMPLTSFAICLRASSSWFTCCTL